MTGITAVPTAIRAAFADPLLRDALGNLLDQLLQWRRNEARCLALAKEAREAWRFTPQEEALRLAAQFARQRAALGDHQAITAEMYEESFAGDPVEDDGLPDGDWNQALGDPGLVAALTTAAHWLDELKRRARAGSVEEWVLRYLAAEPFDAPPAADAG